MRIINDVRAESQITGVVFAVITLVIALVVIEGNGLLGNATSNVIYSPFSVTGYNTTMIYNNTEIMDPEVLSYFNISMGDQYGNTYYLNPKIIFVTTGNDFINESSPETGNFTWTEYSYALVRGGAGSGDFGDSVAFLQLWDARNSTIVNATIYEFSRSSWGSYNININNTLVYHLNSLFAGYTPPATGFVEGKIYEDGTHTP